MNISVRRGSVAEAFPRLARDGGLSLAVLQGLEQAEERQERSQLNCDRGNVISMSSATRKVESPRAVDRSFIYNSYRSGPITEMDGLWEGLIHAYKNSCLIVFIDESQKGSTSGILDKTVVILHYNEFDK